MKRTSLVLAMVLGLFVLLTVAAAISYAMSQEDEALIRKIDGRRYMWVVPLDNGRIRRDVIDVRGNFFVSGRLTDGYSEAARYEIRGRVTTVQNQQPDQLPDGGWVMYWTYTISDDGERITEGIHWSNGYVREDVYFWQR